MTAGVNALISRLESASNTGAESSATMLSPTFAKNKVNRNFVVGGGVGGTPLASSVTGSLSKKSEGSSTTVPPRVGSLHKPPQSPTKNPPQSPSKFQLENREQTLQMLQAHSEPKLKLEPQDDSTFGEASASGWSAAQMTTGGTNPAAVSTPTTRADPKAASQKPNLVKSTMATRITKGGAGPSTGTVCSGPATGAAAANTSSATAATANTSTATPTRKAPDGNSKVVRTTSIKASELGIKLSENSTPEELEGAVKKWKADQRMKQQQQQQQANKMPAIPDQKPDPDGNRHRSKSRGRVRSKSRGREESRGGGERPQSRGRPRVKHGNGARSQSRGRARAEGGGNDTEGSPRAKSTGPNPSSTALKVVDAVALTPRRSRSRGRPRILRAVSDAADTADTDQSGVDGHPKKTVIRRDSSSSNPNPDKKATVKKRIIVRRRHSLLGSIPTMVANLEPGTDPMPTAVPASEQLVSATTPLTTSTKPGNDITNTPPTASPTGDASSGNPNDDKKPTVWKKTTFRRRSLLGSTTPTTAANSKPGTEPVPMAEPASEQLASATTPTLTTSTTPGNDITNTPPPTTSPTGAEAAPLAAIAKEQDAAQLSPPTSVKNNPVPSWEYLNTPPGAKKKVASASAAASAAGTSPTGQNARMQSPQRQVKRSSSGTNANIAGPPAPVLVSSSSSSSIIATTTTTDPHPPSPEVIRVRRATSRSPAKSRIAAAALDHAEIQKRLAEAGISQDQYMAMLKAGLNITLA